MVLKQYFLANVLVGCCYNGLVVPLYFNNLSSSCTVNDIKNNSDVTNALYMIFRGFASETDIQPFGEINEPNSSNEIISSGLRRCIEYEQVLFLSYLAMISRVQEDNATAAKMAEQLSSEISSGQSNSYITSSLHQLQHEVKVRTEEALLPVFMQKQRARARAKKFTDSKDTLSTSS